MSEGTPGRLTEDFPVEGFSLELNGHGLRIRAIDYHATELLIEWRKLLAMGEKTIGDSLKEMIGSNSVINVREADDKPEGGNGKMEDVLQESRIVRALAEEASQRITRKTIAHLQQMRDALHSGEDSGLRDAWDEICVQLQDSLSIFWDAYDDTVRAFLARCVSQLRDFERDAIWVQTPEGQSWDCDPEEDREPYPVNDDDIVDFLARDYVYREACDWSNARIRAYIEQG